MAAEENNRPEKAVPKMAEDAYRTKPATNQSEQVFTPHNTQFFTPAISTVYHFKLQYSYHSCHVVQTSQGNLHYRLRSCDLFTLLAFKQIKKEERKKEMKFRGRPTTTNEGSVGLPQNSCKNNKPRPTTFDRKAYHGQTVDACVTTSKVDRYF